MHNFLASSFLLSKLFEEGRNIRDRSYVGRYAATPSGPLHLGNLRTALLSWLRARSCDGTWLLRIDDLDTPRIRSGSVTSILKDLRWLGLQWDGSVLFQSKRKDIYDSVISFLRSKDKIYPCRCSRKLLAETYINGSNKIYSGRCRNLNLSWGLKDNILPSLRLKVSSLFSSNCGDIVLRRSDGIVSYNLASVVDELSFGINEVVRGEDLLEVFLPQLAIFNSLGEFAPVYKYAPIMLGEKGKKLSKRFKDNGLECLKEKGLKPHEVIAFLVSGLGLIQESSDISLNELLFELKRNRKLENCFIDK